MLCYQKYLETTGLLHYPNNRKMLTGTITSQLFTFIDRSSGTAIQWVKSRVFVYHTADSPTCLGGRDSEEAGTLCHLDIGQTLCASFLLPEKWS